MSSLRKDTKIKAGAETAARLLLGSRFILCDIKNIKNQAE